MALKDNIRLSLRRLDCYRRRRMYDIRIAQYKKKLGFRTPTNDPALKRNREIWGQLTPHVNPDWYAYYAHVSGIRDENYIPEDIQYIIVEPCLNDNMLFIAYCDKNSYDRLYDPEDKKLFPEVLIRNMAGVFYDRDYKFVSSSELIKRLKDQDRIIVKPTLDIAAGGKAVRYFSRLNGNFVTDSGEALSKDYLDKTYGTNYIIQRYIRQHEYFNQLNPMSVNTIRIYTYRRVDTNEVVVQSCILRVGKPGNHVDNFAAGGMGCRIQPDGRLFDFAVTYELKKFDAPFYAPEKKFASLGAIPRFEEMQAVARRLAAKNYYHRLIGFDFCLDEEGNIRVIELNNMFTDVSFLQMHSGSMYREHTQKVIDYCLQQHCLGGAKFSFIV